MIEVKITVDGKEYAKSEPTLADWKALIECQEKNKDKNALTDFGVMDDMARVVAAYVGAPENGLLRPDSQIAQVTAAFRAIDRNVVEAFFGEAVAEEAAAQVSMTR